MKHHINNAVALMSVILILTSSVLVYNSAENMLTGYSIYDPDAEICHQNIDSCIDLDGDGMVGSGSNDETIFSCLIDENGLGCPANDAEWITLFGNSKENFTILADFDNDGGVSQLIDFQRCYVTMRDRAIDEGTSYNVTCNLPQDAVNDEVCRFGCPDLNGDGFVDKYDLAILTSDSVWKNDSFNQTYPMADMTNDSVVDWADRNCMSLYSNEYALCNLPRHFEHENVYVCPDLENITTDLDNDGFVGVNDKALFDSYFDDGLSVVDFTGEGDINWKDRWVFDEYYNYKAGSEFNQSVLKVVGCNLYHAAWHTGGLDQNISWGFTGSGGMPQSINFTVFDSPADNFDSMGTTYGWLTKARIRIEGNPANTKPINVTLIEPSTGKTLARTEIPPFGDTRWATAYFALPPYTNPRLTNGSNYTLVLDSPVTEFYEIQGGHNFQTWMTTAHGDLNGDGIVDSLDDLIISAINDNLQFNGTSNWSSDYDLNNDSIIDNLDLQIFVDAVGSPPISSQSTISVGSYSQTLLNGGGIIPNGGFSTSNGTGWPHKWVDNQPDVDVPTDISVVSGELNITVNNNTGSFTGVRSKKLKLKPNTKYNVTAKIKIPTSITQLDGTWELHRHAHNGFCSGTPACHDYTLLGGDYSWDNSTSRGVWHDKWWTIETGENVKIGYVFVITDVNGGNGTILVDDVSLHEVPGYEWFGGAIKLRQKFTANTDSPIKVVQLNLAMDKGNDDDITVKILDETFTPVGSTVIPALHNSTPTIYNATFTPAVAVTQDLDYYIEVSSPGEYTDYRWFANYD